MRRYRLKNSQHGATVVEFALIAIPFLTLLIAIMEFGRYMYTLEMAANATRVGARMAVVCDIDDPTIKGSVQSWVPQLSLSADQVTVQYFPAGCTKATCQGVRVAITGATFAPVIPFLSGTFPIPSFSTSLPRESLESANAAGEVNPVCA